MCGCRTSEHVTLLNMFLVSCWGGGENVLFQQLQVDSSCFPIHHIRAAPFTLYHIDASYCFIPNGGTTLSLWLKDICFRCRIKRNCHPSCVTHIPSFASVFTSFYLLALKMAAYLFAFSLGIEAKLAKQAKLLLVRVNILYICYVTWYCAYVYELFLECHMVFALFKLA